MTERALTLVSTFVAFLLPVPPVVLLSGARRPRIASPTQSVEGNGRLLLFEAGGL